MDGYVETSEGLLHFRDYGGTGNPILLIHGLGGSVANWDAVGPALATSGHTLAVDLPGFGLSPPPSEWSLSSAAAAVRAFAAELEPDPILVGNSMGGLLAEIAVSHTNLRVGGLILVAPATPPRFPDPRIHWPTASRLAIQAIPLVGTAATRAYLRRHSPEELVQMSLEVITHAPNRVPMPLIEEFNRIARVRAELPWSESAVPLMGRSIARYFRRPSSFVAMVRDVRVPTLVVQGMQDRIVSPTSVEWLCSLRPDWNLVQMEDTGHTPQIDAPVRFLGVVRPWLQGTFKLEITA